MHKPALLREQAFELRRAAQTTREAERQRVFPFLANQCEQEAMEIERGATPPGQLTGTGAE